MLSVIKYRVVDTLVGAGLSYIAMLWLWPTWEYVDIKESVAKSVKANKDFLCQISLIYQEKGVIPTSYILARKEVF